MAVNTEALGLDYAQKWNWRVEIDGYERARFFSIDRPKAAFDIVEINAGGTHRPVKVPGRVSFDDLTAERGVVLTSDPDFVAWMEQVLEFASGAGGHIADLVKTIDIVEFGPDDAEINRWRLFGAWISNFDGNNLSADSEALTENMTITYQYFKKNP